MCIKRKSFCVYQYIVILASKNQFKICINNDKPCTALYSRPTVQLHLCKMYFKSTLVEDIVIIAPNWKRILPLTSVLYRRAIQKSESLQINSDRTVIFNWKKIVFQTRNDDVRSNNLRQWNESKANFQNISTDWDRTLRLLTDFLSI